MIAGSSDAVWKSISEPGNLERAHPWCAANPVFRWPGVGSHDAVHYLSGWVYERHFVAWLDGVGYDLTIGGRDEPRSEVSWRITDEGDEVAALTITVRPRVIDSVPLVVRPAIQRFYVAPRLRRYLEAVTRGFEWYVTTGEPVTPNQFGRHPWFS